MLEKLADGGVRDGVGEDCAVNLVAFRGRCFGNIFDRLLAGAVYGGEVDDNISGLVDEVTEDDILFQSYSQLVIQSLDHCRGRFNTYHAGSSVGNEHACRRWGVQIVGNRFPGLVKEFWVGVANECIGFCLCLVLILAELLSDRGRISSK